MVYLDRLCSRVDVREIAGMKLYEMLDLLNVMERERGFGIDWSLQDVDPVQRIHVNNF